MDQERRAGLLAELTKAQEREASAREQLESLGADIEQVRRATGIHISTAVGRVEIQSPRRISRATPVTILFLDCCRNGSRPRGKEPRFSANFHTETLPAG